MPILVLLSFRFLLEDVGGDHAGGGVGVPANGPNGDHGPLPFRHNFRNRWAHDASNRVPLVFDGCFPLGGEGQEHRRLKERSGGIREAPCRAVPSHAPDCRLELSVQSKDRRKLHHPAILKDHGVFFVPLGGDPACPLAQEPVRVTPFEGVLGLPFVLESRLAEALGLGKLLSGGGGAGGGEVFFVHDSNSRDATKLTTKVFRSL